MNDELQRMLGIAAIILAIGLGLGSCQLGAGAYAYLSGGQPAVKVEFK